jgi:hypothetical protein
VVSFTIRPLYSRGKSPWHPLAKRLIGIAGLDVVERRKIPNSCRESKSRTSILKPIANGYTD